MQSWKRWKFCCPFFLVLTNPSTFQSQVQIQSNQNGRNKKKTYRCVAKYRLKLEHEHYTLQILNYHLFFYITDLFSHILTYSHLRPVPSHLHYGRALFIFCFNHFRIRTRRNGKRDDVGHGRIDQPGQQSDPHSPEPRDFSLGCP